MGPYPYAAGNGCTPARLRQTDRFVPSCVRQCRKW
jgi:hypothetical protein